MPGRARPIDGMARGICLNAHRIVVRIALLRRADVGLARGIAPRADPSPNHFGGGN